MAVRVAVETEIGGSDTGAVVTICAVASLLPLAVLLVLHAPVLEPDFDLALRQVEIARQLPSFLLGNVGVEQELFLQFQRLELGVGLPLLPHRHLTRPLQRIGTQGSCHSTKKTIQEKC